MNLLTTLGSAIREERLRKGLSQEALAEQADLHRNFIGMVERGSTAVAVDSLSAIAAALGLPASELLRRAEAEVPGRRARS